MLVHELEHINNFNAMWFSDLDRGELLEGQKESLSNIVASGYGTRLLHPDGQPLIEIESSYFRNQHGTNYNNATNSKPLSIRLVRRHHDRCSLSSDGSHFSYMFALSLGPIEHHLDVLYNLPKELSLGQPLDWRYGQLTIKVPKMIYELTLKQAANYKLDSSSCPLDIGEVVYLLPSSTLPAVSGQEAQSQSNKPQLSISTAGLALNNQTIVQLERLFDDYTRPITTRRLRQMLRFYLNSKTLPLSAVCNDDYC